VIGSALIFGRVCDRNGKIKGRAGPLRVEVMLEAEHESSSPRERELTTLEPAIFLTHPGSQDLIEMTQDLHTVRAVEPTVVVYPATHHRVDDLGKILEDITEEVERDILVRSPPITLSLQ
jgi:hypothetical protein